MRAKIEKGLPAIFLMLFILVATHAFAQHSIEKHQTKTVSSNSNTYDIIKHEVKKGDNLSGLAYRYKTTVKDIKQSNKINREQVFLGEILKIPYNTKNAKGTEAFINYTIHRGDSLSIIAAKYKTDTKSIKIVNNLARSQINVGQKIVIPYNKKYESSDSFKTDVSKKVVSKATEKPIPVKVEEKSNKGYLKNIEEKYLSFVEKQKELLKANSNERQPLSDKDNNKVVKSAAKTSENSVSNDKNIGKTAQISDKDKNIAAIGSKSKKDSIEKESVKKDIKVSNISEDKKKSDLKANKGNTTNPYIRYKVKSGDNLSTIAENYSSSTKELRTLNNLRSNQINIGQRIKIPNKQYIKPENADSKQLIASSSKENSKSTGFSSTNQKSSADKNYADLEKLIKENLIDGDKKEVNAAKTEIKKTVAKKESGTSYIGYVVKRGDSISILAEKYNTTSKEIRRLNNLKRNQLNIGQKIKIPKMPPSPYIKYRVKSGDSLSILAQNHGITTKELMEVNGLSTRQINIGQRLRIPKGVKNQDKKPEISDTVLVAKADIRKENTSKLESKTELNSVIKSKKEASEPKEIAAQKTKNADQKIAEIQKESNKNSQLDNVDKKTVSVDTRKNKKEVKKDNQHLSYVVKSGDSLSILAQNHGITTKELMEVNGLTTRQINIGQRLRIPKGVENQDKKPEISDTVLVAKTDAKSGVKKEEGPFQIDSKEELIIIGVDSKKEESKPKEIAAQKTNKADLQIAEISKDSNENSVLAKADKKAVSVDTKVKTVQSKTEPNLENKISKQGKPLDLKPVSEVKKPQDNKPELVALNTKEEKAQKVTQAAEAKSKTLDTEKNNKEVKNQYLSYKVKSGDSLSILAQNNGITTKELMELNGLNRKQINIGQRLKIPVKQQNNEIKLSDSEKVLIAKAEDIKPVDIVKEEADKIENKTELNSVIKNNEETSKPNEVAAQKTNKTDSKIAEISKDSNENSVLAKADKEAVSLDTSIKTLQSENKANQNEIETSLDKNISKPNDKPQAIQVASEEKKEVITTNNNNQEVESKNGDSEKLNAANDTIKDSNLKKDELELNLQSNEQEMAGKLVYMPEEGEKLNEDITLAQLLTIENSNIAEQENRYENFLDDQIMLVANSENNERYETFAQKSPDTPTTINRPEKVDIDEGIVDIPDEIDLRDFVRTISEITRESYILDNKLKSKKVTIVTPKGGFNKKNAIRLFEAMLLLNGFTIYKKGIINVITETRNIKQKDIEVLEGRIISDPSDRYVTQIIPLKNISAQDVANTLKPLISREGDIVVYAPLNTLIIVETKSNLQRLMTILDNVDKEKDIIFVKIYNSEASDISAMLTEIFGGASASPISTTARGDGDRAERRRSSRRSAARSSAGQSEIPGFKIITDERTNSLIIISYPDDIPKIKAAIERLDVKVAEPEHGIYVIRLKNGDAEQIVGVLNSLISGVATSARTSRGFKSTREAQAKTEGARARVTRASAISGAIAEFSLEDIRITSDVATNSIIVVGSRREFESVKRVVDELDIRRRQVFVEAAILEVSMDQLRSIGTNLSIGFTVNDDTLGFGGTNLPGVPSLLGAAVDAESTVSLVGSLSGMFLGIIGEEVDVDGSGPIPPIPSFTALFQALTSITDVNILSTPSIVTTDNEQAEIIVADVIPFPTGSTIGDSGVTVNSIDRQPIGIRLAITPRIGDGDYLSLEIEVEVSSVRPAPPDLNTQDFGLATTTRSASSSVVVKNGQTIVIGGLVQDRETISENRVPGLGNVPILGHLFKFKSKSTSKINLMILLTPRIIEDERDMKLILEDRQKRNMLLQERSFDTEGVY
ncbi:MAG: type II secretion system secretin GspD [Candidatus Dadabacteria bacterium]|nr:type II secretion system secretin GspD [Candidatus Dadabacteria bacterium]